jgi:hypothetical protein
MNSLVISYAYSWRGMTECLVMTRLVLLGLEWDRMSRIINIKIDCLDIQRTDGEEAEKWLPLTKIWFDV